MRSKVAAFGFMLVEASVAYAHARQPVPVDNLRAIAATMPTSAEAYEQGKRLLAGSDLPGALAAFRQALSRAPGSIDALNGIAVSYDRLRRPDIARTYYEAALAIAPNSASLLNNLGYSLYLQGDRSAAIAPLRAAAAGMFGRRDAGLQASVQRSGWQPGSASPRAVFDSDDLALNEFAARMSAGPAARRAQTRFAELCRDVRNA